MEAGSSTRGRAGTAASVGRRDRRGRRGGVLGRHPRVAWPGCARIPAARVRRTQSRGVPQTRWDRDPQRPFPLAAYRWALTLPPMMCWRYRRGSRRPLVYRHGRRLVRSRTSTGRAAGFAASIHRPRRTPLSSAKCARSRKAPTARSDRHALSALSPPLVDGRVFRNPARLQAERIRSLLVDRSGKLWIGHDGAQAHCGGSRAAVCVPRSGALHSAEASSACRSGSEDARLPVAPGEACRIRDSRGIARLGAKPVRRPPTRPSLDRHAGRPDPVRRQAVRAYSKGQGLPERDNQRCRGGPRG